MTDPETLRIIAGWLNNLAELTRHGEEGRPTKNKLAVTATMLGKDFPSSAFTTDSLHAVAQGAEWFPPYDTIRQRVAEWWHDHRPACVLALPAPKGPNAEPLTPGDWDEVTYWKKRQSENFAGSEGCWRGNPSANLLDMIRQRSPAAWRYITGSVGELAPREPTMAEKRAVADALRSVRGQEAA